MNNDEQTPEINRLWDTQDVMDYTGWKRTCIQRLVSNGTLPYIPGKPHKFIPNEVKKALMNMQVGGKYGRRKARKPVTKQAA